MRDLQAKLEKKKQRATNRRNIKRSLRVGAAVALEEAKRLVPVDTGRLKNDLDIRAAGNAVVVRSTLPYANSVEFRVKSYMRAAQKNREDDIVNATKSEFKKIVL